MCTSAEALAEMKMEDCESILHTYFSHLLKKLHDFPIMYNEYQEKLSWIKHVCLFKKKNGRSFVVPLYMSEDYDSLNPLFPGDEGILHMGKAPVGDAIYYATKNVFEDIKAYNEAHKDGDQIVKLFF